MFQNKTFVGFVPARAGSKRIKNKNLKLFTGQPLIQRTLDAAQLSKYLDNIFVSTDSPEIQKLAIQSGVHCPALRPSELASDTATTVDVVLDFLEHHSGFDYLVLLQPTSPLRTTHQIDAAIEKISEMGASSLVSLKPTEDHPSHTFQMSSDEKSIQPLLNQDMTVRSQDLPNYFTINGAIYIVSIPNFLQKKTFFQESTVPFIMDAEHSVDIDTEMDFAIAELIWRLREQQV